MLETYKGQEKNVGKFILDAIFFAQNYVCLSRGYTAPFAVDWNEDGLIDIISSDNSARVLVYLRYHKTL